MDEDQTTDGQQAQENFPEPTAATNQLDDIKKQALEALTPIIDNLDIDPERKFDICISAMRFTDDKAIAKVALEAALAIEEKGPKAEALVELVNEINYLQQQVA